MAEYVCPQCGDDYQAKPSARKKFCSRNCYNAWRDENRIVHCQTCGVECGRRLCNDCLKAEMKQWKADHPERVRANERKRYSEGKYLSHQTGSAFKTCSKCGDLKHRDQFDLNPRNRTDGRRADCKQCRSGQRRQKLGRAPRKLLTADERRKARKERKLRLRERKIAEYLELHGVTPLCPCGCGIRVGFNANGAPNKYAGPGHQTRLRREDAAEVAREQRARQRDEGGYIPLDKFVEVLRAHKERENLTWREIAERGGVSLGHLNTLIYKTTVSKSVSREWATAFFRRMAGLSAEPSRHQLNQLENRKRALKETESKI